MHNINGGFILLALAKRQKQQQMHQQLLLNPMFPPVEIELSSHKKEKNLSEAMRLLLLLYQ
jgi:hypothetical protein